MAKKRRRRRAKARKTNPKKRAVRRRKRRAVANPRRTQRRRRRAVRARARANPRRSARRRRAKSNPGFHARPRRRRSSRRGSRKNPGGPLVQAAIAIGAGVVAFGAVQALGYLVTKDMAKDGQRNRGIVGALAAVGGVALMKKKPFIGLALAAGALLGAFGGWITVKVFSMLPAKTATKAIGAVYAENMQALGAVYAENMQAVYAENMQELVSAQTVQGYQQIGEAGMGEAGNMGEATMGAAMPPGPPWMQQTPFGPG